MKNFFMLSNISSSSRIVYATLFNKTPSYRIAQPSGNFKKYMEKFQELSYIRLGFKSPYSRFIPSYCTNLIL